MFDILRSIDGLQAAASLNIVIELLFKVNGLLRPQDRIRLYQQIIDLIEAEASATVMKRERGIVDTLAS